SIRNIIVDELSKDYITAFRLDASSNWHILSRGIFANIFEHIVGFFTPARSTGILAIAAFGVLKLGAQPPTT
ncbi:peptide ABC transporter permease, partial [Pseudoalteromonas undina]